MGMTDNTKMLIKALSENNIIAAKKCAIACMSEDITAKNAHFVSRYKPILENSSSIIELPANIKYKVEALDMSTLFKENRYYLNDDCSKIVDNIIKMRTVSSKLAELEIPYLNSTLLYGESGTGKTTLAKYIAYKLNLPYIYLNFSQIIESYMGKTSSSLGHIFNYVRANPCVFMIDEIDAIGIRRSQSSNSGPDGEMNRVTITLMQELDKLPNDTILIAATNRLDMIDEALRRRFTTEALLKRPSEEEKQLIAKKYIDSIPYDFEIDLSDCNTQSDVVTKVIQKIADKIIEE